MFLNLVDQRRIASELSGGTSSPDIKSLAIQLIQASRTKGSLLDIGAGKGELLSQLFHDKGLTDLTGVDLFERPSELPSAISWYTQDLNDDIHTNRTFDIIVCSETIEHLENPPICFVR